MEPSLQGNVSGKMFSLVLLVTSTHSHRGIKLCLRLRYLRKDGSLLVFVLIPGLKVSCAEQNFSIRKLEMEFPSMEMLNGSLPRK